MICAKGLEQATGKLLGEVLAETLPHATQAVLSGPSFAADVARGLPAALTLATADETLGRGAGHRARLPHLRIYWSGDTIGVQLGGAVKNVLAIAAGIVDGRGLGASAHAALVTRGFAELRRFGEALGAQPETLMGLSGPRRPAADLRQPAVAQHEPGPRAGPGPVAAIRARQPPLGGGGRLHRRSRGAWRGEKGIDMPICQAVHAIVGGKLSIDAAIEALLSRPQRAEG